MGSKKEVFILRSVSNIVIAPAKTGRERRRRMVVNSMDQTNRGVRSIVIPGARIFIIVVIKLIDAIIEEAPAKCKEKIARSTHPPPCATGPERGG